MDPVQAWMLIAFTSLVTAALLLLELGMRRERGTQAKRLPDPIHRRIRGDH